jgi:hypothetical protein
MVSASVPSSRRQRLFILAVCLLLIGGLFTVVQRTARADDPPKPSSASTNLAEVVKMIDDSLEAGWKENKITPARPADDYEFIRRASIDIIGRIAKPEEIDAFFKDPRETRRAKLIDRLLASEDYPRNWANIWSNWLLTRSGIFGRGTYHDQMQVWLEDKFAENKPYDQIVKDLITAKGKNTENGATNFILAHLGETVNPPERQKMDGRFEMVPITARITRLFLGVQTQCTQCHDHPFDGKLKQQHFWGVNAFLRQVDREGQPPMARAMMAFPALTLKDNPDLNPESEILYEKRNGVIVATKAVFLPSGPSKDGVKLTDFKANRREELASLILEHDNFPKAIVNRMWAHFFGKGFTTPIDDFQEQNQPSNPELLQQLGDQFKHYGYDQKMLIRWVCNSRAYGLSSVANKTNEKPENEALFSRMLLKTMSPEELVESLMVATQMEAGETADGKKTKKEEWLKSLIDNFGDDEGNEVNYNGTVVQALMMMNGKDINDAISHKEKGTVARAMTKKGSTAKSVIRYLYIAALNREPTEKELLNIEAAFKTDVKHPVHDRDPQGPFQDLFWALLNSNEFMLNH